MTQSSPSPLTLTIGMDLGIRKTAICVQDAGKKRIEEAMLPTRREALMDLLTRYPGARVVMEASAPSRWISELAKSLGHEVLVSNPRDFRVIAVSHKKSDRDARILASFGKAFPELLHPVELRGAAAQVARGVIVARQHAVHQRSLLITFIRAQARNMGESLPTASAAYFHRKVAPLIPEELEPVTAPLLKTLQALNTAIKQFDGQIESYCKQQFPETAILRRVAGVGPNTTLGFVTTNEDPTRFKRSRDVGAYLGLASRSRSSGAKDPDLRISKRGDRLLRTLLVNAANYILTRYADCDLKRYGKRLSGRGGQAARGKARIAVARKLAVLLHRLWVNGEVYDPIIFPSKHSPRPEPRPRSRTRRSGKTLREPARSS